MYSLYNVVRGMVHGSYVKYAWSADEAEVIAASERRGHSESTVEVNHLGQYPEVEATVRFLDFIGGIDNKIATLPGVVCAVERTVHETVATLSFHPSQYPEISRALRGMDVRYSYFPPEVSDGYVS